MVTMLIALHVVICILLVVTVLLQFGKGAEMGAVMGGGGASQAVFSSSAKGNFLTKLTTVLAIGFMVNSIVLTTIKSRESKRSILDDEAPIAAPLNSDVEALDTNKVDTVPGTDAPATEAAPGAAIKDAPAATTPAAPGAVTPSTQAVPSTEVPPAHPVAPVPATREAVPTAPAANP